MNDSRTVGGAEGELGFEMFFQFEIRELKFNDDLGLRTETGIGNSYAGTSSDLLGRDSGDI
jgi:hypothetical protein